MESRLDKLNKEIRKSESKLERVKQEIRVMDKSKNKSYSNINASKILKKTLVDKIKELKAKRNKLKE